MILKVMTAEKMFAPSTSIIMRRAKESIIKSILVKNIMKVQNENP